MCGMRMRLSEGLLLRLKDVDFDGQVIVVRSGNGDKERVLKMAADVAASPLDTLLPAH